MKQEPTQPPQEIELQFEERWDNGRRDVFCNVLSVDGLAPYAWEPYCGWCNAFPDADDPQAYEIALKKAVEIAQEEARRRI